MTFALDHEEREVAGLSIYGAPFPIFTPTVVDDFPLPLPGFGEGAPSGRIAFIVDVAALLQVEIDRRGSLAPSTNCIQEWSCSAN